MRILKHRTREEQQQHNNRYYLYCLTLSDSEIGHDKDFRRPPYSVFPSLLKCRESFPVRD